MGSQKNHGLSKAVRVVSAKSHNCCATNLKVLKSAGKRTNAEIRSTPRSVKIAENDANRT